MNLPKSCNISFSTRIYDFMWSCGFETKIQSDWTRTHPNTRNKCSGAKSAHSRGFLKKFSGEPWRTFSVILELDYIKSLKSIYYQFRSPGIILIINHYTKNRTILYFSNVNMSLINHIILITNLIILTFYCITGIIPFLSLPFPMKLPKELLWHAVHQ